MQTSTGRRPRGRPRNDAASVRPLLHIRVPPELKVQLEQDARRGKRTLRKEIESRLQKSYLGDAAYGGSQMAAMFREMAEAASAIESAKNQGSLFEIFEVFAEVRESWVTIIRAYMPPPSDALIADLRKRETRKSKLPPSTERQAAEEWLNQRTPSLMLMALASTFGQAKPVEFLMGSLAKSTTMSSRRLNADIIVPLLARSPDTPAVGDLGSLIRLLKAWRGSKGTLSGAAKEVSRLAEVMAEAMDEAPATETCASQCEADAGGATARP